jgi:hypothetical protein
MTRRPLRALFALSLLSACTQDEQELPFSVSASQSVSKTISASGGTLSTPSGASLTFPNGSLAANTAVTITPTAPSAVASAIGTPLAAMSMAITPSGTQLAVPAQFQMLINSHANAWMAVMLLETAGSASVFPSAELDITNHIMHTDISRLGTLTPIIPPASAIITIPGALAASVSGALLADAGAAAGVKTISKSCGGFVGTTYVPCPGLSASASANVIARFPHIVGIFPTINGSFTLAGDPALGVPVVVTGNFNSLTTFRFQSGGGAGATSLDVTANMAATAASRATQVGNTLTITNLNVTTSTVNGGTSTTLKSVNFTVSGSTATVTESRTISLGSGVPTGTVSISLAFDITTF